MNECHNWDSYNKDPRAPCKYGVTCYQKNIPHHQKFKHPPKESNKKNRADIGKQRCLSPVPEEPKTKALRTEPTEESASASTEKELVSKAKENKDTNEAEETPFPQSPEDVRQSIKQKFLVDMPQDFFDLWDHCCSLNKEKPEDAFADAGLTLVGPYDVLSGKLKQCQTRSREHYLCHWRFYYDPPEFQTVLVCDKDEMHYGYFRDDPLELPSLVAVASSTKPGILTPVGDNIFAAVSSHIQNNLKICDPFTKASVQKKLKALNSVASEKGHDLASKTARMKQRDKKVVAKSFNGIGIVVPYDKKSDIGYREIPETAASLKRILKRIVEAEDKEREIKAFEDLQELVTNVQFANDEGDFGMGLELGLDLLSFGGDVFHSTIRHLLMVAYKLLDRNAFAEIIEAHLKNRRRGVNLSIICEQQ